MADTQAAEYSPIPAAKPKVLPIGLMRNRPNQDPRGAVFDEYGYKLAIVELDDQGICYNRDQMKRMSDALHSLAKDAPGRAPVIAVFVHGWRHNSRTDDSNLQHFRDVLHQIKIDAGDRPVFGVYAAWRGLSWYGLTLVELATFWTRKQCALRVALGSVRELLGRLRSFRNAPENKENPPLVVIIGHSFGGLIVYSALAEWLIEAAGMPDVPGFADLVLLVNPAFEAARYLPVLEQIKDRTAFRQGQPPVFICVTAYNDWATKWAFPAGMFCSTLGESTRRRTGERRAVFNTMGHIGWLRTHELSAPEAGRRAKQQPRAVPGRKMPPAPLVPPAAREANVVNYGGMTKLKTLATPGGANPPNNPFWIVGATPEVVDGHDGIFGEQFFYFVRGVLVAHLSRRGIAR